MKTIVLASENPVKIQAVLNGFQKMFPEETFQIHTASVPSGVNAQPMTSAETLTGAMNRAQNAATIIAKADFWVGIEGGVEETNEGEMAAFAWVVIIGQDIIGKGKSGTFFLPPPVCNLIRQGKELGEADDIVFDRKNSKQDNGAIGLLTDNAIDRKGLYEHAVILALVPFKNLTLYL
ncbi:MAG: inosine/xanthosine triphosphatase [Anaerolineales bacterium]|jgi:inosine/xanthosine triphosphatase